MPGLEMEMLEVSEPQIAKASKKTLCYNTLLVKALSLVHEASLKSKKADKKTLLTPEVPSFSLVLGLLEMKVKKAKTCPIAIPVPHSVYAADTRVCLFVKVSALFHTKDPQRTFKDIVETQEITYIKRVMGVGKLSKKFRSYEAKRMLADEYDLFVTDERVLPLLPKSLGKTFLQRKAKIPVKVDLSKADDVKARLDAAVHGSTYLHLGAGTCLYVVSRSNA
jgi:ribosome biogenesis protein UTP30